MTFTAWPFRNSMADFTRLYSMFRLHSFVLIVSCTLFQVDIIRSTPSTSWPGGTYGLPKPLSGCPSSDDFIWQTGWIYQETGGFSNTRSTSLHLDAQAGYATVNRSFCIKTDSDEGGGLHWPKGKYCLYKKGECPAGMKADGFIKWDDEDFFNQNSRKGVLPDGDYSGTNTIINFCCKTDGNKHEPIILPSQNPFYLLAYESSECQHVQWALATSEWIRYDTDTFPNTDDSGGTHPYGAGINGHTIYYCRYEGCNRTLSGTNGTFQSPNYPGKYPNGQLCSWKIETTKGHRVLLRFNDFTLQKMNNTDSIRIFDGENETSPFLGEFYGDHVPPREGLASSSDVMFVIFKSDAFDAYAGFQASFESIRPPSETTLPGMTAPPPTSTSIPVLSTSRHFNLLISTIKRSTLRVTPSGDNKKKNGLMYVMISVSILCVVMIALLLLGLRFWRRNKQKNTSNKTSQAPVHYESGNRSSNTYETVNYGKWMEVLMENNTQCLSVDNENVILDTKCSKNVLYCSFNNDKVIYSNLSEAQSVDKESQNPLYISTENLVSD